jgi:3-oxoacyl-[acyl-carrier protein] reductase
MFELTGKTALVTGASGGMGAAIARALAGQGATVAVSGTRTDALESLAAEIGEGAQVVPADLARDEGAAQVIRTVEDRLGRLDILVHNAGITRDNLCVRMSDGEWQEVLAVNLTAGFRMVRAALRGMMKRRWGRIIGITSVVGVTGNAGQLNYAASKAGMIGMVKSLAQEVASRGITANCIAPGMIDTGMTAVLGEERTRQIVERIPVGRIGTAAEVAACAVFLASEEAAYVTGQTLHANGGMVMV